MPSFETMNIKGKGVRTNDTAPLFYQSPGIPITFVREKDVKEELARARELHDAQRAKVADLDT